MEFNEMKYIYDSPKYDEYITTHLQLQPILQMVRKAWLYYGKYAILPNGQRSSAAG